MSTQVHHSVAPLPGDCEGVGEGPRTSYLILRNKLGQGGKWDKVLRWLELGLKSRRNAGELLKVLKVRGVLPKEVVARAAHVVGMCGDVQEWRWYFGPHDARLRRANFCNNRKLCQLCAHRYAVKQANKVMEATWFRADQVGLTRFRFLTLTCRDGNDVVERLETVQEAFRILMQRGRKARDRDSEGKTAWKGVMGAYRAIEVIRGANSGQWHVHIHAIVEIRGQVNPYDLLREWSDIVGQDWSDTLAAHTDRGRKTPAQSFWVPVKLGTEDSMKGFLEICKYAVKFGSMEPEDVCEVYERTWGVRLVQGYGTFYRVQEADLEDDLAKEDLTFADILFRDRGGKYRVESYREGLQVIDEDGSLKTAYD